MAVSVVATVTLAAGSLISAPVAAAKGGKKITLAALYVQSGPIHLDLGGKPFRVGFAEDQVGGTGDQWHAAGWNAATVGTLLTGSPLNGRTITFDVNGEIDGPSPGALMTIGVIALLRGDKVKNDITMTGTINPDGTIGPVGGIPYKIDGVVQAHKKRMLIPLGERNSHDDSGQLVDVVAAGADKGVKVTEVADIYEAYKQFTGKTLPRPGNEVTPKLSNRAYNKLKALTDSCSPTSRRPSATSTALPRTSSRRCSASPTRRTPTTTRRPRSSSKGCKPARTRTPSRRLPRQMLRWRSGARSRRISPRASTRSPPRSTRARPWRARSRPCSVSSGPRSRAP